MTMSRWTVLTVPLALAVIAAPALAGADPAFCDFTATAGVTHVHDTSGYNHSTYTGGGTVGDFNRDGFQDLLVLSGGDAGVPDKLFINNGDGTFTDQAAAWGLTAIHKGKGAAAGDINHDGWPDIYVTSAGPPGNLGPGNHMLYRNNGNGTFTNIAAAAGVDTTAPSQEDGFGAGFGDYDLDGDLDLFVAGFASGNVGSRLFENDGSGNFTDITAAIGFFAGTGSSSSFAPQFADMDGDWYPDLLLVSDFGTNRYFRNNGGVSFTNLSNSSGADLVENGMGQCIGDFNGDGLIDWYVTSIYHPPISWTGNKLFINTGNHTYSEEAAARRVDDGGYGWGSVAIDFNHDGLLDIAETNGSEAGTTFDDEQAYLWIQVPSGNFNEVALGSGFVHTGQGRGMAALDIENDGDQDVVIFANNEALMLLRNDIVGTPDTSWLRIFLDTRSFPTLAPNGTGARVYATIGGESQMRYMSSGDHFLSHSEHSAHFGLGAATQVDELRVDWPDGTSLTLNGVNANQTLTLSPAGIVVAADFDADGVVAVTDLLELLAQWGPCPAWGGCAADIDGNGTVDVVDLLALLAAWTS